MWVNVHQVLQHLVRMYHRSMVFPEVLAYIVQGMPEFTHYVHAYLPRVADFTTPAVLCNILISNPEIIADYISYNINIGSPCRVINLRGCNDTVNIIIVYCAIFEFLAYFSH